MKIKTITCHNVYNVGASLQAYALAAYLSGLGNEVQIVDYVPDYLRHYRLWPKVYNPGYDKPVIRLLYKLAKFPGQVKGFLSLRRKRFDRFTRECLPLTRRHYASWKELLQAPPQADLFIAGSDQIWNSFFPNGRDPAFYLQFAPEGAVRASYAASFAVPKLEEQYREQTAKWISQLDHVSVREDSALEILEELGIRNGVSVVDPVFLLTADQWDALCPPAVFEEPYVFVYDFDNNPQLRRIAQELSSERGLKIYTLQQLGYGHRSFPDAGPVEFVQLVRGAAFVLSNSFHATAFSLIYRRPYLTVDREEGINTRMQDLNRLAGLEHRKKPEDPIDWNEVHRRLEERIAASREYLDAVTKGICHD
ncbi:MAG: polysaccharide pyruvyl transferase family protein [Oscillospiraceae bacterium]|nr:polysaccharide pyruvyl transferase family protein [Oscillospiraceae bacterium]